MSVEVRVIPSGVSGLAKKTKKPQTKKQPKKLTPARGEYQLKVRSTVQRMERDNELEKKRITIKQVKKIMRTQLQGGDPNLTGKELDDLVVKCLPRALEAYRGAAVLIDEPTEELRAIWKARKEERKRIIKANRLRRKADQPMSKSDRRWVEKGLK